MAKSTMVLWIVMLEIFVVMTIQVDAGGYYCPSFCDPNGYYHESHHCHSPEVYCCGTAFHRSCCSNKSLDISSYYPEKYNCNTNTWMQVHWQVMITMTGSVLLVLLFSACCCQCCRICNERMEREHRVRFNSTASNNISAIVTDSEGNQFMADSSEISAAAAEGGQVTIQMFNPDSPFAFTPPEYNSLPKDPPKYNDVFSPPDGGNMNPCYIPDTPPPPFSEVDATTGPPLPVQSSMIDQQEAVAQEVNPEDINEENTPVVDNVEYDDVVEETTETEPVVAVAGDTDGFVDVDLSTDVINDLGRPLTSANPSVPPENVDEARQHCLNGDSYNNNNDNNNTDR